MNIIGINKESQEVIFSVSRFDLVSLMSAFTSAASESYRDYLKCSATSDKEVYLNLFQKFSSFHSVAFNAYKEFLDE